MNMNGNHQTPTPAPRPLCAVYAPLLPLLQVDELDADQANAVREHLADCAWCQAMLATHAVVGDALRRHIGHGNVAASPLFTLETIMHANQQDPTTTANTDTNTRAGLSAPPLPHSTLPRRRNGRLTAVAAIAAVLLLAILTGTLFAWQRAQVGPVTPNPIATATPALDAQRLAYVAMLKTYYPPFVTANNNEGVDCSGRYQSALSAQKLSVMQACRPMEVASLHAAQALLAHLQSVTPPARWQAADTQLKQAAQGHIAFATERIKAIDARDANRFVAAVDNLAIPADILFCSSLGRITTDLKNAGVSPVDLQDLQPNDVTACLGVPPAP